MILAGDIGGTNSRLAFFDVADGQLKIVTESIYPSKEARGLDEIVVKFVNAAGHNADIATFGIAGPVRNGRVETSNLPWVVESKRLAAELKTENVSASTALRYVFVMMVRERSAGSGANFCVNFTVHLFVRGSRTLRIRSRVPVM